MCHEEDMSTWSVKGTFTMSTEIKTHDVRAVYFRFIWGLLRTI